jgi:hypothetical protein
MSHSTAVRKGVPSAGAQRTAVAVMFLLATGGSTSAWHSDGHARTAALAVERVAEQMPPFFGAGGELVAHCALDPDVFRVIRNSSLHDQESPEHFINPEHIGEARLPPRRSEFHVLCASKGVNPLEVGTLPYAVTEWTQRLAIALKEHRRWPDNRHVQTKCFVYAGILAHYAGDLCMPLHLTVDYDGRVGPTGKSPRSGIHAKVDALLGKVPAAREDVLASVRPRASDDIMGAVLEEMQRGRGLIDVVYGLEPGLPDVGDPLPDDPALRAFAEERLQAVVTFLSSLYLSAWELSGRIYIPDWHQRPAADGRERP